MDANLIYVWLKPYHLMFGSNDSESLWEPIIVELVKQGANFRFKKQSKSFQQKQSPWPTTTNTATFGWSQT